MLNYLLYPIKLLLRRKVRRYKSELAVLRAELKASSPRKHRREGMTEKIMMFEMVRAMKIMKYERFIKRWGY